MSNELHICSEMTKTDSNCLPDQRPLIYLQIPATILYLLIYLFVPRPFCCLINQISFKHWGAQFNPLALKTECYFIFIICKNRPREFTRYLF